MKIPGLRSPYDETGGIVYFARMLDKIRLHATGKLPPEYVKNLGTGFDARCCTFLKVDHTALRDRTLQGGTDGELLAWSFAQGRQPTPGEIEIWNAFMTKRGWRDEGREMLEFRKKEAGLEHRNDIMAMFDFIDADEERPLRH